jgi:UDP-N-acetyl-D-mannosaminuronate dehydrogenase
MLKTQDDLYAAAAAADLVILLQPHKQYDLNKLQAASQLLLDTRGLLLGDNVERL